MPAATPMVKIRNTELLGASVVVQGDGLDEAYALARNTAARDGSTLVHPYDDERIIAGQGTVGLEILGENRAIGRASCRERVRQDGSIPVVAAPCKKKQPQ